MSFLGCGKGACEITHLSCLLEEGFPGYFRGPTFPNCWAIFHGREGPFLTQRTSL